MSGTSSGPKPASILLVDDALANLRVMTKMLKEQGYEVRPMPSGALALKAAENDPPDLILLDINLPEMSGFEVLRHLRDMEATKEIPVVALSANAMADDLRKGEEAGFNGYLTKPINVKEFFSVLEPKIGRAHV